MRLKAGIDHMDPDEKAGFQMNGQDPSANVDWSDLSFRLSRRHEPDLVSDTPTNSVPRGESSARGQVSTQPSSQIVVAVDRVFSHALECNASDIHIESASENIRLRFRIDGRLHDIKLWPKAWHGELFSRLRILAGLDIAEQRRPQDGRITLGAANPVDIRVSIIPSQHGTKAVLRILDASRTQLSLSDVGLEDYQESQLTTHLLQPNGLILVTGPTGSGKTTTLYAALRHLRSNDINISTAEDPIEYRLEGITQTQVRPDLGVGFASLLRSLLRQDPDIILVGEIRDAETLGMALRASMTGHLVLSTLHTNSAPASIARLLDMGAEPYLLAGALRLVVAQRLVRKICPICKGSGCDPCLRTGYSGRKGVFELLQTSRRIARSITAKASEDDIRLAAKEEGMQTISEHAELLVQRNITTTEEVRRVLGDVADKK